jgi:hypothetical protein
LPRTPHLVVAPSAKKTPLMPQAASVIPGLRKTVSDSHGAWLARHRDDEAGKQLAHSLGHLDDAAGAD